MSWLYINAVPFLSIIGILFDIVGAFFVAIEVVSQFHGEKYKHGPAFAAGTGPVAPPPPRETDEFAAWDRVKFKKMRLGLILLVVGFVLQLIANVVQIAKNAA
jgi:hypothetical protein